MNNHSEIVIGERVLRRADGAPDVLIKLFLSVEKDDGSFVCQYQIVGIGDEKLRFGAGMDSIQAIQITLQKIGMDIYLRHKGVRLTFGDLKDSGFPPPDVKDD